MTETKKTIVVQQTSSAARRPAVQTATLKGLGLNKIRRTRELEDTPSIRGMVHAVRHMVKIIEERG
ncbi:MAG: 50S ribosomal protein L30 [Pseudomonadota bacterium]|jgi:large subunit ribosomal protein L30